MIKPKRMSQLSALLLRHRLWCISVFQACLVSCSMVFAWLLRFDFRLPGRQVLLATIPILVVLRLSTMAYFGLLRGWWRYTGTRDVIDLLKAVGTASVLCWFCLSCAPAVFTFPPSPSVI